VVDCDSYDDKKLGGSDMECVSTAMRSGKNKARPPTYDFERLLKEACPNYKYPIKHKLEDYGMMKNFMTSRSLIRDKEPEEYSGGSGMLPSLWKMQSYWSMVGTPFREVLHV
jgi:hypothetical protein